MGRLKVERSTVQYYINRMNSLYSIKNPEERHTFVLNTFLSFQKDTWQVALSPQVCRCLEQLLSFASVDSVTVVLKTLSKSWDEVINSKFAYHLLHKALIKCLTPEYHADELISSYVESFCTHMKENLSTYVEQPHTTHTCRIYPQILAGVLLEKDSTSNTYKSTATQQFTPYDENYAQTLTDLCEEYLFTKALKGHVKHEFLCPFTQVLLLIASVRLPELLKKKYKKLMKYTGLYSADAGKKSVAKTKYPNAYSHPVAVYFSELLIGVMPGSHFADFLNNRILTESASPTGDGVANSESFANLLMSHPTGSCVLRAVIRRLAKSADIKNFLTVIQSCKSTEWGLRGALSHGQYNVLTELADLCSRHPSDEIQRIFLQMLPPVFGFTKKHNPSSGKEDLFICCLVGMLPANALNEHIQNHSVKQELNEKDGENNAKVASGEEEEEAMYIQSHCLDVYLFRLC
ncbi:unnamed protein product [Trichobilharzia szidati]|nr:unnamed protein product [Trichobilharzia szidati]